MNIGERIKYLRQKNNMTQIDLATKIQSTKQTIYKYENGIVVNIPYDKIVQIAKALSTTPSYLMGWEENVTEETTDVLVEVLCNNRLLEYIQKIINLSEKKKERLYGYIDNLCESDN